MKLKLFALAILLASIVIGCSGQKEITEKPTVEETGTAEQIPTETPAEEVEEITTLENDVNEVNDLLNELKELENINFEI